MIWKLLARTTNSPLAEYLAVGRAQVPGCFASQPETVDAPLCRRVAALSRLCVPAVSFQLGGIAASAALDCVRVYDREDNSSVDVFPGQRASLKEAPACGEQAGRWFVVDEIDSPLLDERNLRNSDGQTHDNGPEGGVGELLVSARQSQCDETGQAREYNTAKHDAC